MPNCSSCQAPVTYKKPFMILERIGRRFRQDWFCNAACLISFFTDSKRL